MINQEPIHKVPDRHSDGGTADCVSNVMSSKINSPQSSIGHNGNETEKVPRIHSVSQSDCKHGGLRSVPRWKRVVRRNVFKLEVKPSLADIRQFGSLPLDTPLHDLCHHDGHEDA